MPEQKHPDLNQSITIALTHQRSVNARPNQGSRNSTTTHNSTRNQRASIDSACKIGDDITVRQLLEQNPNLQQKNSNKHTLLHTAIHGYNVTSSEKLKQKYLQIIKMLIEKDRAIINIPTNKKMTPMHLVCTHGSVEIVKLLLQYNPDLKSGNQDECTALHLAVASYKIQDDKQKYLDIMQMLIQHDPLTLTYREQFGKTARQFAVEEPPFTPELAGIFCHPSSQHPQKGFTHSRFFSTAYTVASHIIPLPPRPSF